MKIILHEKDKGAKVAWFFMIITIISFLNSAKDSLNHINQGAGTFENGFVYGADMGSKLGLITLLGIGMILYNRTKKRRFGHLVKGSKIIDYVLAFILSINLVSLISGDVVNGPSDDITAFWYILVSLVAYAYALFAKIERNSPIIDNPS